MTTDPDGKPYAHNAEQTEAAKLAAISDAAIREAVPEAFWHEERMGLVDQLNGAGFKVECLRAENVKLRAALTACHSAMLGKVNPKHPAWGVLFAALDSSPNNVLAGTGLSTNKAP